MPFIDVGLDQAQEPEAVPEGPYNLRVISFDSNQRTKAGDPKFLAVIAIEDEDHPDAQNVFLHMAVPTEQDDASKASFKRLQIARFLHAFGIPVEDNGFNDEDVIGCTADNVLLKQDELDDGTVVNVIQLPRLPNKS